METKLRILEVNIKPAAPLKKKSQGGTEVTEVFFRLQKRGIKILFEVSG